MILKADRLRCVRGERLLFSTLSFALSEGEALFIEGKNGSGKSSLLRLLAGLAAPDEGEILWDDAPIQYNLRAYHDQIHYLSHLHGIKLGLTVTENITLTTHLLNQTPDLPVEEILGLLQLHGDAHTLAKHLSAGQKRRLALMKLWLFPKKIWLLDEPLTSLDQLTEKIFLAHLDQHLQNKGMVVASSHHPITLLSPTHSLRLDAC